MIRGKSLPYQSCKEPFPNDNLYTALSGVMRYTTGGQDAHPTRVLLLKFVPHSNGICCNLT
ncbi:MAG: hypothetical protein ACKOQS_03290 [Dolichospermum sp.]